MPGAGSLVLANWLYNVGPKTGLVFGTIGRGTGFDPLLGSDKAKFDATKFNWIGSMNDEVSVCVAWHTTGITKLEQVMEKELVVGGTGPAADTDQFPKILNGVLGTKFKIVSGYPGGNDVNLAMERGEVQGRCGWSWSSVKSTHPHGCKNKQINILAQLSLSKHEDLPDVPLITDLAKNDEQQQIFRLVFARQVLGRPFLAPPGVPADRVAALRKAFMDTMKDKAFLAEAKKAQLEITPVAGREGPEAGRGGLQDPEGRRRQGRGSAEPVAIPARQRTDPCRHARRQRSGLGAGHLRPRDGPGAPPLGLPTGTRGWPLTAAGRPVTFRVRISAHSRARASAGQQGTPMDAKIKNYTGWQSDVIVDMIKRYGFPFITLNPGASFRGLHDSLVNYGNNEPPMMLCNHEEIAVQIAHGYAKATGKPAAVILHNLVGLLHACMAIYYAYPRPRADLHHGRHRPDGRIQAPPAHRLDPHRAGAGQRGARLHQVGLPADLDPRRAGELRARLLDHDDRAEGPDLHVLRRRPAGSADDREGRRCRRTSRCTCRRRWRPIRARSSRSPTSSSRPSIRCCSPSMPAGARTASTTSSSSPRPPARRCGTSTTRSTSRTSIRCA